MTKHMSLFGFVPLLLATLNLATRADEFTPPLINVPDGYVVELAAAPPLVKHPMMAGFDDRGRLFIAESAGKNLRRADLEKELPNFVRMIEDTDGDGVFDKSTIFADKLTYPMGALWHDGWLYVASSGAIWRFQDTDDDGIADVREQLVNEFGYTGNAADVHGCFLGPCGRLYWCEGRHGHEFRDDSGHVLSKGKAARIFSCQPDGSDVRVHCGGGMDNPVEVDFTAAGEMLGTVNILYRQRGDCLVHWLYGGVYPRHDQPQVTAEFKKTGDLLPPLINLGHVAVSGTTRYRSRHFGDDYQGNFFVTQFNTHNVVRTKLQKSGSTFTAEAEEFLSSSSGDFHPTDVLEDADGSLLVIDTGGWFRIGCPTSQIAKPNILGAIYRVRRQDAPVANDPRGLEIDWKNGTNEYLAGLLGDDRHAVRQRAIQALRTRGAAVTQELASVLEDGSDRARMNALWVLARIPSPQARGMIRQHILGAADDVRLVAMRCAYENFDPLAFRPLVQSLRGSARVSRVAATILGKLGQKRAVKPLLQWASEELDRPREHALIYALIEINARRETAVGLGSPHPDVQRSALIALDQMDDGRLSRAEVTSLLDTTDLELQRTAFDVIARHPQWSGEVAGIVRPILAASAPSEDQLGAARTLLTAFAGSEPVQVLAAEMLADRNTGMSVRRTLLEAMRGCNLPALPSAWRNAVAGLLAVGSNALLEQAIGVAEQHPAEEFVEPLRAIGAGEKHSLDVRVRALAAGSSGLELSDPLLGFLGRQLDADAPVTRRLAAAGAIGSAKLTSKQLAKVTRFVANAGPLELPSLLGGFESNSDSDLARGLLAALRESPGLANLSLSAFDRAFGNCAEEIKASASSLRKKLRTSTAEQAQHLETLLSKMDGGDPRRGQAIFQSRRTSCVSCHQVQGQGGRIGPDLSTTGARRSTRDLLEAILFPNASLARGFESFLVLTTDGKVHTGMIVSETTETIQLRTPDQRAVTIRREDIDELQPSNISIMPAGLDRTMSSEDLRDLIAYLKTLKPA